MEESPKTTDLFGRAKRVYYALCWIPLSLFVFVCIQPDFQVHRHEQLIYLGLFLFPAAGIFLVGWGLGAKKSIWGPIFAMVPGCLILLWFAWSTGYMHFLQGLH